jgi:hypothetical protein
MKGRLNGKEEIYSSDHEIGDFLNSYNNCTVNLNCGKAKVYLKWQDIHTNLSVIIGQYAFLASEQTPRYWITCIN